MLVAINRGTAGSKMVRKPHSCILKQRCQLPHVDTSHIIWRHFIRLTMTTFYNFGFAASGISWRTQDQELGRSACRDTDEKAGNQTQTFRGARGHHGQRTWSGQLVFCLRFSWFSSAVLLVLLASCHYIKSFCRLFIGPMQHSGCCSYNEGSSCVTLMLALCGLWG